MLTNKKKKEYPVTIDQWIEVQRKGGETITTYYPPNDELERLRLDMDPPPELIYRRLNFIGGVPWEYRWTQPNPNVKMYGGLFIHRMNPEDWQWVLDQERLTDDNCVVPSPRCQPRPAAFGPCPCGRCAQSLPES